jgi:tetratricopeptide (TPR) repeat protein
LCNLGVCSESLGKITQAIDYYQQALTIDREIADRQGEGIDLGNLGGCYANLGQIEQAIEYREQALAIAREIGDRNSEGRHLGSLGLAYASIGQITRAIEHHEQALAIAREIGDRSSEATWLDSLGNRYSELGQTVDAIDHYRRALVIARDIGERSSEAACLVDLAEELINEGRYAEGIQHASAGGQISNAISSPYLSGNNQTYLALAYLFANDLRRARVAVEEARQYDIPTNNHFIQALLGLVALRQGEGSLAREAFATAIAQADGLLGHCAQNYAALNSKGLALCGLALIEGDQHIAAAIASYRAARAINSDAGVVGRALRLFDALALADTAGILVEVRAAAGGE